MRTTNLTNAEKKLTTSPADTTERSCRLQKPRHTIANGRHASSSAAVADAMVSYIESYKKKVLEQQPT